MKTTKAYQQAVRTILDNMESEEYRNKCENVKCDDCPFDVNECGAGMTRREQINFLKSVMEPLDIKNS